MFDIVISRDKRRHFPSLLRRLICLCFICSALSAALSTLPAYPPMKPPTRDGFDSTATSSSTMLLNFLKCQLIFQSVCVPCPFLSVFLCVGLPNSLLLCNSLYHYLSVYLSVAPCSHLTLYVCLCLFIYISVCQSLFLYLYDQLSFFLCHSASVCMSLSLSVSMSLYTNLYIEISYNKFIIGHKRCWNLTIERSATKSTKQTTENFYRSNSLNNYLSSLKYFVLLPRSSYL